MRVNSTIDYFGLQPKTGCKHRDFDSLSDLTEESKVKYIAQRWEELGLDVRVTNHTALLSYPGPALSTIVDKIGNHCYLPSGARCGQPSTSTTEPFAFAAYSAVGSLVAEVVDVQYGSPGELRRVQNSTNVTNKIALLKLGQAPLLYKLSLLAEVGFGGSLLYVDPCDASFGNKTFGVTLNPGGNPFSQENSRVDRYVLVGSRHGSWYEGGLADWGNGSAVMAQIIASMTAQTRGGWLPDRTIVFCSWGGTSLGNIGSYEWGKRHSMSCSRGGGCPGPNVSSLQTPGDTSFFSNQLAVPTVEFTYSEFPKIERACFLSEAFFPPESSLRETLDPAFKLHENIAKFSMGLDMTL
ncbi:unnamed protein product [Leuciscus chuanchicus]